MVGKFLLALAFGFFVLSGCDLHLTHIPKANRGTLNLTSSDSFDSSSVALIGEWEFYWKKLYAPQDFKNNSALLPNYDVLPSIWNGALYSDKTVDTYGYATYRLKILLSESEELGLKIPKVCTAYRIWINGEERPGRGRVGTRAEETIPQTYSNVLSIQPENGALEIVMQVANYNDIWGGLRNPIILGKKDNIFNDERTSMIVYVFLIGTFVMAALYHLGLFLARTVDRTPLYFSLLCFSIALNALLSGDVLLIQLFPKIPWEVENKLEYLSLYLSAAFFCMYLNGIYSQDLHRWFFKVTVGFLSLLTVPVLLFSAVGYTWELNLFEAFILIVSLYIIYVTIKTLKKKRIGSVVSFTGFSIFFLTIVNELISNNSFVAITTPYLLSFGLFGFILFQSFVISLRFSDTHRRAEVLGEQLKLYSTELEDKIQERTKQLEDSHRQKIDFFLNLAHETRTPLTLILNYLNSYIQKNPPSNELDLIQNNFLKMKRDMVNYLDLEKLNRNQLFYNHDQPLDLSLACLEAVNLFQSSALAKRIQLTISGHHEPLWISLDPSAFQRIVNNLLENAIKFTPFDGKIYLYVERTGETVRMCLRDSGDGIPKDEIDSIFLPFYQRSVGKRNTQGMGLGLSIVKKVVEDAGGNVGVESSPGEGTSFIVTFPRRVDGKTQTVESIGVQPLSEPLEPSIPETSESSETDQPELRTTELATVLIVEDNEDLREFLYSQLKTRFILNMCQNGVEAIQFLESHSLPDLILSDIMMDGMDGHKFLEEVQRNVQWQKIPFLFVTARSSQEDRIRDLKKGVVDTILKPFHLDELVAKIRSVLLLSRRSWTQGMQDAAGLISGRLSGTAAAVMTNVQTMIVDDDFDERCRKFDITDRQKEIIKLLSQGHEYKEIASTLFISTNTVNRHIQNLYEKTGSHNRVELLKLFFPFSS